VQRGEESVCSFIVGNPEGNRPLGGPGNNVRKILISN
jgi:hypothetical protein